MGSQGSGSPAWSRKVIFLGIAVVALGISAWRIYAWRAGMAQEEASTLAAQRQLDAFRDQMPANEPEPLPPQAPPEGVTNHGPMAIPGK